MECMLLLFMMIYQNRLLLIDRCHYFYVDLQDEKLFQEVSFIFIADYLRELQN